jgi:hypothetical protein
MQPPMHASLWWFRGDPDDLLRRYEALVVELPPAVMRLHLCLRADDGLVLVDTCPGREAFESFARVTFPELRQRHGLPEPERVDDHPVHLAFVDGQRRAG